MIYKLKIRKGIDDLKSLSAFHGNTQGDDTNTNSIEDYNNSGGYLSFTFDCEMTPEAIAQEIAERKKYNENYITELKEIDEYGKEAEVLLNMEYDDIFDKKEIITPSTSSYKMIILDFT